MKKFVVLLMVLCLLGTCALAEGNQINWSDVEEQVAASGIEGDFYSVADIGVKMFIPAALKEIDLSDEDVEEGYICYLSTDDQSAVVAVMYADFEGNSLEDYAAILPDIGATGVEMDVINGIPAVTYEVPENDSVNVAMMTDTGYAIEFVFNPASDEGFKSMSAIMCASIQAE